MENLWYSNCSKTTTPSSKLQNSKLVLITLFKIFFGRVNEIIRSYLFSFPDPFSSSINLTSKMKKFWVTRLWGGLNKMKIFKMIICKKAIFGGSRLFLEQCKFLIFMFMSKWFRQDDIFNFSPIFLSPWRFLFLHLNI